MIMISLYLVDKLLTKDTQCNGCDKQIIRANANVDILYNN